MSAAIETGSSDAKAEQIRAKFRQLLDKTNKEHPAAKDVRALADLLNGHKGLRLWRDVLSAAEFAERVVIENAPAVPGVKECWKHRLSSLRKDLGYAGAPILEQLLIQQGSFMLVKAEPGGAELLKCDEAVHYTDIRCLLGETTDGSGETIHQRL